MSVPTARNASMDSHLLQLVRCVLPVDPTQDSYLLKIKGKRTKKRADFLNCPDFSTSDKIQTLPFGLEELTHSVTLNKYLFLLKSK